jgi:hypothetical protein
MCVCVDRKEKIKGINLTEEFFFEEMKWKND